MTKQIIIDTTINVCTDAQGEYTDSTNPPPSFIP